MIVDEETAKIGWRFHDSVNGHVGDLGRAFPVLLYLLVSVGIRLSTEMHLNHLSDR